MITMLMLFLGIAGHQDLEYPVQEDPIQWVDEVNITIVNAPKQYYACAEPRALLSDYTATVKVCEWTR